MTGFAEVIPIPIFAIYLRYLAQGAINMFLFKVGDEGSRVCIFYRHDQDYATTMCRVSCEERAKEGLGLQRRLKDVCGHFN
jgi:hypothetical protein